MSHGRLKVQVVAYEYDRPDVDIQLAKDVRAGRIDVASMGARAWESVGVLSLRAFQAPFVITSRALLDKVTEDPRVNSFVAEALAPQHVVPLALAPAGVRYLFATRQPLSTADSFTGRRVRTLPSSVAQTTLSALGATPVTGLRSGPDTLRALQTGKIDVVESDPRNAVIHRYGREARRVDTAAPLFAKVTTIVVSQRTWRRLGGRAQGWLRRAGAAVAASTRNASAEKPLWAALCGSGLRTVQSSAAALDRLRDHAQVVFSGLDADPATARLEDRIGLLATAAPRIDPAAHCGNRAAIKSPSAPLDGTYVYTLTQEQFDRRGAATGNVGTDRMVIGNGRYAIHVDDKHLDPTTFPGWDADEDPVEVGSAIVEGDSLALRPDTSLTNGSVPGAYRFELFRDKLRLRFNGHGAEDVNFTTVPLIREH